MDSIEKLTLSVDALHGRMNGMLAALVTMARTLPKAQAQHAHDLLTGAAEHISADAVASPLPDAVVHEQERLILEFVLVLAQAAAEIKA